MSIELTPQSTPQPLDYLTRTVMTAFGRPELLPTDTPETLGDYVTDFEKAFPGQADARGGEDVIVRLVNHFGPGVLRSSIMKGLQTSTDPESVAEMADTLSDLAGGDERSTQLADRIQEGLRPWTTHFLEQVTVSPADPDSTYIALSMLSQGAIQNFVEPPARDAA